MGDRFFTIVFLVTYGLTLTLGYGYTQMGRSIMVKLTKKETKEQIDLLITNLRMCDPDRNCKKCKHKNECLNQTRHILSWILEVFSVRMGMNSSNSSGVYL